MHWMCLGKNGRWGPSCGNVDVLAAVVRPRALLLQMVDAVEYGTSNRRCGWEQVHDGGAAHSAAAWRCGAGAARVQGAGGGAARLDGGCEVPRTC